MCVITLLENRKKLLSAYSCFVPEIYAIDQTIASIDEGHSIENIKKGLLVNAEQWPFLIDLHNLLN